MKGAGAVAKLGRAVVVVDVSTGDAWNGRARPFERAERISHPEFMEFECRVSARVARWRLASLQEFR
jgi:hypothetical protein